ncbi:MAG: HAD-IA family hydrolase [Alphaproteobacteria bacterium]
MMMKATDFKCVIFDLDGTLVDTAPDLLATLNVLFARRGHREITLSEIRTVIGHGAKALLREGGELTGNAFSETEIDDLFVEYLEYYGNNIADHSQLFPGGKAVLDACQAKYIGLAICTNKLESLTLKLLKAMDLTKYFQTIIGSDTLSAMKPDPAGVLKILENAGCDPKDALFVGDSETDLDAARNACVPCILVDYGYTKTPARELDPDAIISDLAELI